MDLIRGLAYRTIKRNSLICLPAIVAANSFNRGLIYRDYFGKLQSGTGSLENSSGFLFEK